MKILVVTLPTLVYLQLASRLQRIAKNWGQGAAEDPVWKGVHVPMERSSMARNVLIRQASARDLALAHPLSRSPHQVCQVQAASGV